MRAVSSSHFRDRLRRTKALIVKESYQILRDPSSILIAFVLPLLLLFLFGYGLTLDATHVKIGLVVDDPSRDARSLADAFTNSSYFEVQVCSDRRIAEKELVADHLRGIVVIPSYFSERLSYGEPAPLQVISDGTQPNTATFVENYAAGAFSSWLIQQGLDKAVNQQPLVRVEPRFWYNPELNSRSSLLPGTLALIMAIIGSLLTSLVVAREWERGTMEALMATPAGTLEILLGKLIPYFVLGMGSMLIAVATSRLLFGLPLRGSLAALCAVSAAFLLAALGQGLLISTAAKNQFLAAQGAVISAFLPAMFLSGFLFEISSMPLPLRVIARVLPARYLVSALRSTLLVGDIPIILATSILAMLAIAAFFLILTARMTVKRLE
jgi:ABC-2 type transport system permease protein